MATDTEYRMISPEDYDIDGVNVTAEANFTFDGSTAFLDGNLQIE